MQSGICLQPVRAGLLTDPTQIGIVEARDAQQFETILREPKLHACRRLQVSKAAAWLDTQGYLLVFVQQ